MVLRVIVRDSLNIWPTILLYAIPGVKFSERVLVTQWKPDPARFTWNTVCILATMDRGSWNELQKKAGTEKKPRGNFSIWHGGTHLKLVILNGGRQR